MIKSCFSLIDFVLVVKTLLDNKVNSIGPFLGGHVGKEGSCVTGRILD